MSAAEPRTTLTIRGNATDEEVAAVVAGLTAMSAAGAATSDAPRRTSHWAAPHRMMRTAHRHGPDGWKAGALPH